MQHDLNHISLLYLVATFERQNPTPRCLANFLYSNQLLIKKKSCTEKKACVGVTGVMCWWNHTVADGQCVHRVDAISDWWLFIEHSTDTLVTCVEFPLPGWCELQSKCLASSRLRVTPLSHGFNLPERGTTMAESSRRFARGLFKPGTATEMRQSAPVAFKRASLITVSGL